MLHNRMKMLWDMGKDFVDEVMLAMSDGERIADLHGDSTGFGLRKYRSWSHAKHGEVTGHDFANLVTGDGRVKTKILKVLNPTNNDYRRRGVITRGAVLETEDGKCRIVSRPGQDGVVNAILAER